MKMFPLYLICAYFCALAAPLVQAQSPIVPKDFSAGKFEGIKQGYRHAADGLDQPSPLELPLIVNGQWKIYGQTGDEWSWKQGFLKGWREGFDESSHFRKLHPLPHPKLSPADYGPAPTDYEAVINSWMEERLDYHVRLHCQKPVPSVVIDQDKREYPAWVVKATVDPKSAKWLKQRRFTFYLDSYQVYYFE